MIPQLKKRSVWQWFISPRPMAVAAGLLIAAISSILTLTVVRSSSSDRGGVPIDTEFTAHVPSQTVGAERDLAIAVPVLPTPRDAGTSILFPPAQATQDFNKRSTIIQRDGKGNTVVIPLDTLKMAVY